MRRWGEIKVLKLQFTFFGIDQLFLGTSLSQSNPVVFFFLVSRGWKSVSLPIPKQRPPCPPPCDREDSVLSTCWLERDFSAGQKWLFKWWLYFHPAASHFLWLQDFSCTDSARFSWLSHNTLCRFEHFPTTNTEPVKKRQATDLTLWNLLCLMGFVQGGLWEAFCLSCFLHCCWVKMLPKQCFQAARSSLFSGL